MSDDNNYRQWQEEQHEHLMQDDEDRWRAQNREYDGGGSFSGDKTFVHDYFMPSGSVILFILKILAFFLYILPFFIWKIFIDISISLFKHKRLVAGFVVLFCMVIGIMTAIADAQAGGQLTKAVRGEEASETTYLKDLDGNKTKKIDVGDTWGYGYVNKGAGFFKAPVFNTFMLDDAGNMAAGYYRKSFGKGASDTDKVLSLIITLYPFTAFYFLLYILLLTYRLMIIGAAIELIVFVVQKAARKA